MATPFAAGDRLLTVSEVCQVAHLSPSGLRWLRSRGAGPTGFRFGRRVLFREADVVAWLNARARATELPGAAA